MKFKGLLNESVQPKHPATRGVCDLYGYPRICIVPSGALLIHFIDVIDDS